MSSVSASLQFGDVLGRRNSCKTHQYLSIKKLNNDSYLLILRKNNFCHKYGINYTKFFLQNKKKVRN